MTGETLSTDTPPNLTITPPPPPPPAPSNNDDSSVQVAVRVRPMLPFEAGTTSCIEVLPNSNQEYTVVRLGGTSSGPKFTFDQAFGVQTSQQQVYQHRVAPLVDSCLQGYNATILAYGQTGSGKTHTIMGPSASITTAVQDQVQAGVIPRAIGSIFEQIQQWKEERQDSYQYFIGVQFLEVYGEAIHDLLTSTNNTQQLTIRDVGLDEPEVIGATQQKVESAEEALLCLTRGMYRRVTGATAMNASSSRSHAIFSLIVEQTAVDENDENDDPIQHWQAKRSKFNFVDLAGSERQKRTQAEGLRLKEGIDINKGLLVLGNVISALGDPKKQGKTFVPYRDSKLTRLLKGSLGGNHKTLMIACVSPSSSNMEESLNCLRYANRAKNIKNHAVVNVDATSRLVADLRSQVQALATDLLKVQEKGIDASICSFPVQVLESLANGGDGETMPPTTPRAGISNSNASPSPASMRTQSNSDLARTHGLLRQSLTDNRETEQELQATKVEKEIYKLRLDAISCGGKETDALQGAFMTRAAEYEREIAMLKSKLMHGESAAPSVIPPNDFDRTINHGDRPILPNLPPRTPQKPRNAPSSPHLERSESPELSRLRAQVVGSMSSTDQLDAEVEAAEQAVQALTTKYLIQESGGDDEHDDSHHATNPAVDEEAQHQQELEMIRHHQELESHLYELDNSIGAKEELIQQLQTSQEKYESMREFYEAKLKEMEDLLMQKELESEKLVTDLKQMGDNHGDSPELAEKLRKKQEEIAELKKKQRELSRLTSVASRNGSQIAKLTNDVIEMKQKKVIMQKQITDERKHHAMEVQKLKKDAMQKDRELTKMKTVSDRKTFQAEKAQQMAKTRLEQMNQLKTKYKESEKKLRMQTIKRGVMQKAGLDSVMVGRRELKKKPKDQAAATPEQPKPNAVNIDYNVLRNFFDQKVADVGRRESLAEKLAQEWEEHLGLTSTREEWLQSVDEGDTTEAIEALDSQIKFKENRIRQLAARLGKRKVADEEETSENATFLFDKDFKTVVGDTPPMSAVKVASKVLFGMTVRERRRIASLARTASSLDDKVQEAEAAAKAKDTAFRAYVDEQRHEAATLAQSQQEQILSLMNMVREETPAGLDTVDENAEILRAPVGGKGNPKLLLLANERIVILESQLSDLKMGHKAIQKHRDREEEATALFESKTQECEELQEEISYLRSALRQIREAVELDSFTPSPNFGSTGQFRPEDPVLDIVTKALHPTGSFSSGNSKHRRSGVSNKTDVADALTPPRLRRHADIMHTSDSDELPDWAEDIMADLAIIAEGKMPDSLLGSSLVVDVESHAEDHPATENQSVFERLTNPESFTGVQKHINAGAIKHRSVSEPPSAGQRHRKNISKQVADSLNRVVVPGDQGRQRLDQKGKSPSKKDSFRSDASRSVFERLQSPSNLTGTQKKKYQDKKAKRGAVTNKKVEKHLEAQSGQGKNKRDNTSGEAAGQMLDDLLLGDSGSFVGTVQPENENSGTKLEDYSHLNVFERLNKTTTQAYAVKQHRNIAEEMLDNLLDNSEATEDSAPKVQNGSSGFERVDEYAQQNVFERLQKTPTRASAVKKQPNIAEKALDDILENDQHPRKNGATSHHYVEHGSSVPWHLPTSPNRVKSSDDVFERLQNTTTEAYAKKIHPPLEYHSHSASEAD